MFLLSSKGYAHVTNKTDDCLTMNFRCPNKQAGEVNNRGRLGFRVGGYERHVVNEGGRQEGLRPQTESLWEVQGWAKVQFPDFP